MSSLLELKKKNLAAKNLTHQIRNENKNRIHHEGPARQSRNQSSEYLSQRRQDREGRRIRVRIIRKNFIFPFELGDFAP
jgi:hypothetical protein